MNEINSRVHWYKMQKFFTMLFIEKKKTRKCFDCVSHKFKNLHIHTPLIKLLFSSVEIMKQNLKAKAKKNVGNLESPWYFLPCVYCNHKNVKEYFP